MNCDETFNAGICYVTDAYKRVCRFNEELHEDLEKCRSENAKLWELGEQYEVVIADYRSEIVKLRELCADLYAMRDRSGTYHVTALQVRLDELGVEVDE